MPISTNNTNFINNPLMEIPYFQNWVSSTPTYINHSLQNSSMPPAVTTQVMVKDIIGTQLGDNYANHRLKISKVVVNTNNNVQWIDVSSNTQTIDPYLINPYSNGLNKELVFTLQNLNLLLQGAYECQIIFEIQGKQNFITPWVILSQYTHIVKLSVTLGEMVTWTPKTFNLSYTQGTILPYLNINMTGDNWKLLVQSNYILSSPNNDVTIENVAYGVNTASSSGNKVVALTLGGFFNTAPALLQGMISGYLIVTQNDIQIGTIPFNVLVLENDGFVLVPDTLSFSAYKNFIEATPTVLNVFTNWPYTFTKPNWLIMESIAESAPGITSQFLVYPISSSNLNKGTYADYVKFFADSGTVIHQEDLHVIHEVNENLILPYSFESINFTRDAKFLHFISQLPDTFFELEINATVFDYFYQSNASKTVIVPLKIPLFNQQQKQNIGLLIEKMLYSIINPNPYINSQYNAANVILTLKEKNYTDEIEVTNYSTSQMKFLSGLTPSLIVQNCAILDINDKPKRVTAESFAYINLILTLGTKNITVKKNNSETLVQYGISTLVDTYREVLKFSEFQLRKGDKVDFIVELENDLMISKSFIIFPETDYSTMILYEDEYRMIQTFEFTGKYSLKDEYESISQNLYQNLVEVLKKYDSNKTIPISINTGFISAFDKRTIESICNSKRAWIYISDEEMIEIIPITKSLPITDVDNELLSYDLEFQINRKYNEESYSSKF